MNHIIRSTEKNWLRFLQRITLHKSLSFSFSDLLPRTRILTLFAIGFIWLLMILLANPIGDFPLNDDWSYARAVETLVEDSRLELTGFTSMPLIAQVLWGALFCLPFGFSFMALRLSTIMLGLSGILATYWIFEELNVESNLALLAIAVLAINPLYFQLSLTFMTDVPFYALSMLAVLFFLRAIRTDNLWHIFLGYVFSFIAILIRQPAIVIPLSFLIAYLVRNGFSIKTLVNALIPNGAFASYLVVLPILMNKTIGLPVLYDRSFEPIAEAAPRGGFQIPLVFADRLTIELLYLGLFLLPFLIGLDAIKSTKSQLQVRRVSQLTWAVLFMALAAYLIRKDRLMPLSGNLLFDLGIGPLLLRDTYVLGLPHWPTAPISFWIMITVAAAFGCILLFRRVSSASIKIFREFPSTSSVEYYRMLFLFSMIVLYSAFIGIAGFLDRYLIWLLPLLMGVIFVPTHSVRLFAPNLPIVAALILIALYAVFTLAGTHDYLAWNRARWQALTELMDKEHISYTNIDGGFEFNGWYGYDAKFELDSSKSWWWVKDDRFVITFGPISGYTVIKQYPFNRWMPIGQGNIFVLKRVDGAINEKATVE